MYITSDFRSVGIDKINSTVIKDTKHKEIIRYVEKFLLESYNIFNNLNIYIWHILLQDCRIFWKVRPFYDLLWIPTVLRVGDRVCGVLRYEETEVVRFGSVVRWFLVGKSNLGTLNKFGLSGFDNWDGTEGNDSFWVISDTTFARGVRTDDGGLVWPRKGSRELVVRHWELDPGHSQV